MSKKSGPQGTPLLKSKFKIQNDLQGVEAVSFR
jgi:hypothetical protein